MARELKHAHTGNAELAMQVEFARSVAQPTACAWCSFVGQLELDRSAGSITRVSAALTELRPVSPANDQPHLLDGGPSALALFTPNLNAVRMPSADLRMGLAALTDERGQRERPAGERHRVGSHRTSAAPGRRRGSRGSASQAVGPPHVPAAADAAGAGSPTVLAALRPLEKRPAGALESPGRGRGAGAPRATRPYGPRPGRW